MKTFKIKRHGMIEAWIEVKASNALNAVALHVGCNNVHTICGVTFKANGVFYTCLEVI